MIAFLNNYLLTGVLIVKFLRRNLFRIYEQIQQIGLNLLMKFSIKNFTFPKVYLFHILVNKNVSIQYFLEKGEEIRRQLQIYLYLLNKYSTHFSTIFHF